ncbi:MAG: M48 family peptidase [Alphaproteobacteria bacterium]|nr:MAG: M48 family peptidase [Alphaproteobacteria bacterium]
MKTSTDKGLSSLLAAPARLLEGEAPAILIDGRRIPVEIRRSARARRMKLRVEPESRVLVILPVKAKETAAFSFLRQEMDWIAARLGEIDPPVPFRDGAMVPFMGKAHRITHAPELRGLVWAEDGLIFVTGRGEHLPRRVGDWFRKSAKAEIAPRARHYADMAGLDFTGITLRDQKSRWGSCSSTGRLNFSWRLILMPEIVLDYIVAHEVAHLRHMNHSPAFWSLTEELHGNVTEARKWLKKNGKDLHRYGA